MEPGSSRAAGSRFHLARLASIFKDSRRRRVRPAALLWLILLPGIATVPVADAAIVSRTEALASARSNAAQKIDLELTELTNAGRTDDVTARLRKVASNPELSTAARERLLERGALLLGTLSSQPQARAFLDKLENHQPATWVWLEEGGRRSAVPLFDPAAAARVAKRTWLANEAELSVRKLLLAGDPDIVTHLEKLSDAQRRGAAAAIATVPPDLLQPLRWDLIAALERQRPIDAIAATVAAQTADTELAMAVIAHAQPRVARGMLARLTASFPADQTLLLLSRSLDRPEIASNALLLLAQLGADSAEARQLIWAQLADPDNGSSAAAALARLSDPHFAARAAAVAIDDTAPDLFRRRALLALCLDAGGAAQDQLHRVAAQTRQDHITTGADACRAR